MSAIPEQRSGGFARRLRRASLLLVGLALAGCGQDSPPSPWVPLAAASGPFAPAAGTLALPGSAALRRVLVVREGAAWLELEIGRAAWKGEGDGRWKLALGCSVLGTGHRLWSETREYAPGDARAPGTFQVARDQLTLALAAGEEPPTSLRAACRLRPASATPEHVRGPRFSGLGLELWPGAPRAATLDVPAASELRFALALDPLVSGAGAAQLPPLTLRVRLDGELLHEEALDPARSSCTWRALALPEEGRRGARLELALEGTPAYLALLDPVLAPRERGRIGARPWSEERPDVVLFLADTFRADNLALHGGTLALTPNLDRFAATGLAAERAWSAGTFTLSGHAALFSGLYPHQAGVLGEERALPDELELLAEQFRARGYRTGAVTDAGIVSRTFALDQGFAVFDEGWRTLDETLAAARAFLDADDGRPVFLFVHTYRAHRPFRVSDETRRAHGERLGLEGEFEALEEELVAFARARGHADVRRAQDFPKELIPTPEARALIAKLERHYRAGVIDLDRGFEELRVDLERRGILEHGYLLVTSDHGEEFGEHGQLYHKDDVYEEQTRIPLLLAGKGLAPARIAAPVSLVDVPPTLAELAGLARRSDWQGHSLLRPLPARSLYAFECDRNPSTSTLAAFDGRRKVMAYESLEALRAGRLVAAFDQEHDPAERENLATRAAWPAETLAAALPTLERLLVPLVTIATADLSPEKQAELRALGYGGGDD